MSSSRPRGLAARSLRDVAGRLPQPAVHAATAQWGAVAVSGVSLDSRQVQPGDLYAALPGARTHGLAHLDEALARGAVAVLSDRATGCPVPLLVVDQPRSCLGGLAAWVYGEPSRSLALYGVTGTNGKTTTAYLLEAALGAGGGRTGLIGTVETHLAGEVMASARTTPEAPDLQALLAVMVERGVSAAAMEVSSHALALGRVDGVWLRVGAFTNLSQDHLDFHGSLEAYFAAKAALFRPDRLATAVIDIDDQWGQRLVELVRVPLVTVSVEGVPTADWRVSQVHGSAAGSRAIAHGPAGERVELRVALPGRFNLANALVALAMLVADGADPQRVVDGIAACRRVPGRMERVEAGQPFTALVDYAHTPDAVATLLTTLRPLTPGRLVVVLGCGGDRDRGKRPAMAAAAVEHADLAVFTSDNPRSESPLAILAEMTAGLAPASGGSRGSGAADWTVEPDRAAAIALAVGQQLGAGDTLVVAGKGHETGQETGGVVAPFDDREVLAAVLARTVAPAHGLRPAERR